MLRRPTTRNFIMVLLALLLVGGCAFALLCCSRLSRPVFANDDPTKFAVELRIPTSGLHSLGFSDGGKFFYVIGGNQLQVYSSAGVKKFSSNIPGITDAVVSPDGRYIVAYSRRNPADTSLRVLRGDGKIYWKTEVNSAVWSADACLASDGAQFAIGTGDGYVYILDVGDGRKRYRRWKAPGAVVSINIFPSGKQVVLGTWQRSSVLNATVRGSKLWELDAEQANLQNVELLSACGRLIVRSVPNRVGVDGLLNMLDADGNVIFHEKLSGQNHGRVLTSLGGQYICMGYDKDIEHKGKSMQESHATLIDDSGRHLWDKGSSFFPAHPILVTPGGSVLLGSAKNALYVASRSGEMEPSVKLPADVLHSVPSPTGDSALIYCSNGILYKLKVSTK